MMNDTAQDKPMTLDWENVRHDEVIRVENLRTQFGQNIIHQNLNLHIQRGEILSIIGGSGTGKTVLMRQILGLEKPKSGSITVLGRNIHDEDADVRAQAMAHLRKKSGMLFQHGALYSAMNVIENVAQPLKELRCFSHEHIYDIAYLKLHMAGIAYEHAYKMPADLSGGMIKRVALARALALDPEIVFLDEPTAGLDPDSSDSFVKLIHTLHAAMGLTVIMVTHDLDSLFALSHRIAVIADKKIIALGKAQEVAQVKHPFIEAYFGGERTVRAMSILSDRPIATPHSPEQGASIGK